MCAPNPYRPGRKYLVTPSFFDGRLVDGGCLFGRDIDTAADDVKTVRDYFAGRMPFNVRGRVAVARGSELVDFLLDEGEAKPLSGVTVSTRAGGKTWSATTDADGRYTLRMPYAETYTVRADLKPYKSEVVSAQTTGPACAIQNFGLGIDNTISGSVLDSRGNPVSKGRVGLIDLDRPPAGDSWFQHDWFNAAYVEVASDFTFHDVPLGRYLLVFNPDGPRWNQIFDQAFESTYYPSGATHARAKVIEIKSSGTHLQDMNLVMGGPVVSRDVIVRVRFPDGAPMNTAQIRCLGSPVEPGDPQWVTTAYVLSDKRPGTAEFLASANRRIHIEIRDLYGRDLKKSYTADFEPGKTAIDQEFVVTP